MVEPDLATLRYALSVARNHGYCEVEIASGDSLFEAKLEPALAPSRTSSFDIPTGLMDMPVAAPSEITASVVGYYQPGAPPLQLGRRVEKGEVVGVITALGLANDVEANVGGEIVEVLIEPGQPVQFGQVLARVGNQ